MESVTGPVGSLQTVDKAAQLPKARRLNYNTIHTLPIPLNIYLLPPLIPHNPFCLLQIAFTYLAQLLFPPSSHGKVKYQGYFSLETRSVHVTQEEAVRAFWEKGFFGKGNLSRSQPSWLDREKRRKGLIAGETSEEVTKRRREERREFKNDRARKERKAIEEKIREESSFYIHNAINANRGLSHGSISADEENGSHGTTNTASQNSAADPDLGTFLESNATRLERPNGNSKSQVPATIVPSKSVERNTLSGDRAAIELKNEEHLQLTLEEAFFLAYGLGVLEVREQKNPHALSIRSLFSLCRQYCCFPPCEREEFQTDDPFMLSYVVYHHFRSLGWVVRPGVKFAVDYLLYNRGPVFSHAEFAVIILPSYRHAYWYETPERATAVQRKESKTWWWFHCVNRVQSQVRKSLLLVYVDIPPPRSSRLETVSQILRLYKVREVTLKRWIPNRSRD
ncbi:hypothetical protein MMC06_002374 [Schaereria dolodes]|nr:hypothetical protein [Schaereria dolodes]